MIKLIELLMSGAVLAQSSGYISFEDERAKGNLDNSHEMNLTYCENYKCKPIGKINKKNIIEWSDDITMEDLKNIVQGQQDLARYQRNEYKPPNLDK